MKVVEIFESMQGEGYWMGVYCTFIRLAGCNLQCPFCDEHHKYAQAKEMSVADILNQIHTYHVVITGGEPTIHPDFNELCLRLVTLGHKVHVETNGTTEVYDPAIWVTCSPKAPAFTVNTRYDEMKLVVDDVLTIEKAMSLWDGHNPIWLQPCDGPNIKDSMKKITEWIKEQPNVFRAGIQLHKYYAVI